MRRDILYIQEEKPMNITLRDIGMGLLFLGIILLIGFGVFSILTADIDVIIRISLGAIIIGILIALFSLLKETGNINREIERKY